MSTVKQELAAILSEARGKRWQVTKGKKVLEAVVPEPMQVQEDCSPDPV